MIPPAEQLEGKNLDNGWKVVKKIKRLPDATGGHFSCSYKVEKDGKEAFLKAMDYAFAFDKPNTALFLQAMTESYNHEKNLCFQCRDKHLRRIVKAIDAGAVIVDPSNQFTKVEYLIFELAGGDVRKKLESFKKFDNAWVLRSLHHVAVGMNQLHTIGVAHQDIKPSNILVFHEEGSKIADLGSASYKNRPSPRDQHPYAGDPTYAPPELLYNYIAPDWNKRRFGCDMYLMGSMIVFFFTKSCMTALLEVHGNKLEEAKKEFDRIDQESLSKENKIVWLATSGLIKYREGQPEYGRQLYQKSIELAKTGSDHKKLACLALANFAMEELRIRSTESEKYRKEAIDNIKRLPFPDIKLYLNRLKK